MKQFLVVTAGKSYLIDADEFKCVTREGSRYAFFLFYKDGKVTASFDAKFIKTVMEQ